jgi:hypothetical protein
MLAVFLVACLAVDGAQPATAGGVGFNTNFAQGVQGVAAGVMLGSAISRHFSGSAEAIENSSAAAAETRSRSPAEQDGDAHESGGLFDLFAAVTTRRSDEDPDAALNAAVSD